MYDESKFLAAIEKISTSSDLLDDNDAVFEYAESLPHPGRGNCYLHAGHSVSNYSNQIAEIISVEGDEVLVKAKILVRRKGDIVERQKVCRVPRNRVFRVEDRRKIQDYKGESVGDVNKKIILLLKKYVPILAERGWAIRIGNDYHHRYYGNQCISYLEVHPAESHIGGTTSPDIYINSKKVKLKDLAVKLEETLAHNSVVVS